MHIRLGGKARVPWTLRSSACSMALVLMFWPLLHAAAATPTLTLIPTHGLCTLPPSQVVARGIQFPPGLRVGLLIRGEHSDAGVLSADATAAADGSFAVQIPLHCGTGDPVGTRYRVMALEVEGVGGKRITRGEVLASAMFTVSPAAQILPRLPHTGGGGMYARAGGRGCCGTASTTALGQTRSQGSLHPGP